MSSQCAQTGSQLAFFLRSKVSENGSPIFPPTPRNNPGDGRGASPALAADENGEGGEGVAKQLRLAIMVVDLVEDRRLGLGFRARVLPDKVDGAQMIYGHYVAAVAALLAGLVLHRRRKRRKPVTHFYCTFAVPPGGDPVADGIRIFYRNRPD